MRRQDQGERAGPCAGVRGAGMGHLAPGEQGERTCLVRGVSSSDRPLMAGFLHVLPTGCRSI